MRLLVICHGNICRSPVAAAILARELPTFEVRQGGFVNPGKLSPPKIRMWAKNAGYDLMKHRSRLTTVSDTRWADVILYMDKGNLKRLETLAPNAMIKAKCLGSFAGKDRCPDPNFFPRDSIQFAEAMIVLATSALHFVNKIDQVAREFA